MGTGTQQLAPAPRSDATAGCPLMVSGTRRHDADKQWHVLALLRGENGELAQAALTIAEARKTAIDLNAMADLCEGGWRG